MKKILRISTMFLFLVCVCLGFVACKPTLDSINVDLDTIKTEYFVGESQETYENAKVYAIYSNYDQKLISADDKNLSFSTFSTTEEGTKILTISYKGKTQEISITVRQRLDKEISAIEIDETSVSKTTYHIDDEVDSYSNLKVKLSFADGSVDTTVLASSVPGLTVTKPKTHTVTTTETLTVTCQGKTDSVNITVYEKDIQSIELIAYSLTLIKGEDLPTDIISVKVNYTDNTSRTITNDKESYDLINFNIDLTKSGYQDFSATYNGVTSNVLEDLPVYSSIYDTYYFTEFANPEFVQQYYSNIAEKQNKETEFAKRTEGYVVGNDNPFYFKPIVQGVVDPYNEQESDKPITAFKAIFKLEKWDFLDQTETEKGWVELTGNISNTVVINDEAFSLKFDESIVNEKFRISVLPFFNVFEEEYTPVTFEFTVQDGYNVYDSVELSLFDNINEKETDPNEIADYERYKDGAWTEFKNTNYAYNSTTKLIDVPTPNALFLHTSLNINQNTVSKQLFYKSTDKDLPSKADYPDAEGKYPDVVGSFIDYTYVYQLNIPASKEFTLNGNYFSINTAEFPLVVKFDASQDFDKLSHSCLFWTEGEGTVNFNNISFFGNAQKAEEKTYAGGLILTKISHGSHANFNNLLTTAYFTSYFTHFGSSMNINYCKSYDHFSSMIYTYAETVNTATGVEFKRCGGPIAILAHLYEKDSEPNRYGTFVADETSVMENYVIGREAWFDITGQIDLALAIKGDLNKLISGYANDYVSTPGKVTTKNVVKYDAEHQVEKMNLIAVVMDSEGPTGSNPKVQGKFTIGNSGINMLDDITHEAMRANDLTKDAPMFQSNGQTVLFTNGTHLISPATPTAPFVPDPTNQAAAIVDMKKVFDALDDSKDFVGVSYAMGSMRVGILLGLNETTKSVS